MRIEDFALERYFAQWEFAVEHQLSASDVEPLTLAEVLALADADGRARWDRLTLGYTESSGLPALREAIACTYADIAADQVLVLAGAEEGIFLTMHALLDPGDHAIVVTPAYQSLHAVAESIGVTVERVALRFERGWRLDPDEVARAVTPRTRVIAVNFPHNPTGAHIPAQTQRALAEIAESAGAVLLSDEVYRGLEHEGAALPCAADLSERAISLGVMSKSYALAGLRIGWIATRDAALLARVARLKDYTTICSSAPSEVLALMALRARGQVLDRSREIVRRNLKLAAGFVVRFGSEIEWVPPLAGSTAFPRFVRRDAGDVAQALIDREGVLLLPGALFAADPRHFRLGLGRRDLPMALDALERVLA